MEMSVSCVVVHSWSPGTSPIDDLDELCCCQIRTLGADARGLRDDGSWRLYRSLSLPPATAALHSPAEISNG